MFWALSVAEVKIFAHKALARQRIPFLGTELKLAGQSSHLRQRSGIHIAEIILRVDEMVAGIHIPIMLHHESIPTGLIEGTDSRRHSHVVGEGGIKDLDVVPSDIVSYPFIENGIEELPILK